MTHQVPVLNPHACGIDVGSKSHYVAISQDKESVRCFGVYSKDHQEMIAFLKENKVETIAMESTGNYWQTLFFSLEKAGFEVFLVCGKQTKNVKGRKTDVQDCQWIQWLHSVGMLSNSFIPNLFITQLRTYVRERAKYISKQTGLINQMQKDLRMMNVRLEIALNDITSESGKAIIEAIIGGERNPEILANLVNYRVKKSKAEIALSLEGNWESQYIFLLKQHYKEYQQNIEFIKEIDSEIDCLLIESFSNDGEDIGEIPIHKKSLKKNKNKISSDICSHSFLYFGGVDLFAIEGINNNTVLTLMAEVGQDIDKFHSAKAFANWLHLCPNPKISGDRVISSRTKKESNPLKIALRNAANIIGNSKIDNHLTKFFRKIAFKKGRMQAITATAHKLATIIYNMLTKKQPYKPFVYAENTEQKKKTTINKIKQLMQKYNINPEEAFVIT